MVVYTTDAINAFSLRRRWPSVREAGCGGVAKRHFEIYGCFAAYTTSVICSFLANASFSSRRSLCSHKHPFIFPLSQPGRRSYGLYRIHPRPWGNSSVRSFPTNIKGRDQTIPSFFLLSINCSVPCVVPYSRRRMTPRIRLALTSISSRVISPSSIACRSRCGKPLGILRSLPALISLYCSE